MSASTVGTNSFKPRNILAIETCFDACSVAVGLSADGGEPRVLARFEPMATGQAERIAPMIAEVMAQSGLAMTALDTVAVTVGPGSFTGTRIGIAAAKGVALAIGIRAVGFSSLHVIARQAVRAQPTDRNPPHGGPVCIAVDMGRNDVYAQVFSADGLEPMSAPCVVVPGDLAALAGKFNARIVPTAPEKALGVRHLGQNKAISFPHLTPCAETLVVLVTQCRAKLIEANPLYLRPPDAKPGPSSQIGSRQ
jgi:tRNA threonylcarbamoyladenosine biosynthesis protein TsaB